MAAARQARRKVDQSRGSGRASTSPGVLLQNNGAQAAAISAIAQFRAKCGVGTAQQARSLPEYQALLDKVAQTVSAQPLNYLQNFGGATNAFLYERAGRGKVRLKPGVAYSLRRFHPLVQGLARTHWVDHIKQRHPERWSGATRDWTLRDEV